MRQMLKDLTLEYLRNTPLPEELEKAMAIFEKLQKRLYELASTTDSPALMKMKAGTVVTLAVLKKLAQGKDPRRLSAEDWQDIAGQAAEYTAYTDGEKYSLFVFGLYADYIRWSAALLTGIAPRDKIAAIENLSQELRRKAELLRDNKITETAFIEDSLWISLEAMLKLLACMAYYVKIPSDKTEIMQAAADYALEYGRMRLCEEEQALLTEYLDHQKQLDGELEARCNAYRNKLEAVKRRIEGGGNSKIFSTTVPPQPHGRICKSTLLTA